MTSSPEFGSIVDELCAINIEEDPWSVQWRPGDWQTNESIAARTTKLTFISDDQPLPTNTPRKAKDICAVDEVCEPILTRNDRQPSTSAENIFLAMKIDDDRICDAEINPIKFDASIGTIFSDQEVNPTNENSCSLRMSDMVKRTAGRGFEYIDSLYDAFMNIDEELGKLANQDTTVPMCEPFYNERRSQSRFPYSQNDCEAQAKASKYVDQSPAAYSRLAETDDPQAVFADLRDMLDSDDQSSERSASTSPAPGPSDSQKDLSTAAISTSMMPTKTVDQTPAEERITNETSCSLKMSDIINGAADGGFEYIDSMYDAFLYSEEELDEEANQDTTAPVCEPFYNGRRSQSRFPYGLNDCKAQAKTSKNKDQTPAAYSRLAETDDPLGVFAELGVLLDSDDQSSKRYANTSPAPRPSYSQKDVSTAAMSTSMMASKNVGKKTGAIPKTVFKLPDKKAATRAYNTGTAEKWKAPGERNSSGSWTSMNSSRAAEMWQSSSGIEIYDIPTIEPQASITPVALEDWDYDLLHTDDLWNAPYKKSMSAAWKSSSSSSIVGMKRNSVSSPSDPKATAALENSSDRLLTSDLWDTVVSLDSAGTVQPADGPRKSSSKSTKNLSYPQTSDNAWSLPLTTENATHLEADFPSNPIGFEKSGISGKHNVLGMLAASQQSQLDFSPEWCMSANRNGLNMLLNLSYNSYPNSDDQLYFPTTAPKIPSDPSVDSFSKNPKSFYDIWSSPICEDVYENMFPKESLIFETTDESQVVATARSVSGVTQDVTSVSSVLKDAGKCHRDVLSQHLVPPTLQKGYQKFRPEKYHVTPYDYYKQHLGQLQRKNSNNPTRASQSSSKLKMIDPFNELAFLGELTSLVSQPLNLPNTINKVDEAKKKNIQNSKVKRTKITSYGEERGCLPLMGRAYGVPERKTSVPSTLVSRTEADPYDQPKSSNYLFSAPSSIPLLTLVTRTEPEPHEQPKFLNDSSSAPFSIPLLTLVTRTEPEPHEQPKFLNDSSSAPFSIPLVTLITRSEAEPLEQPKLSNDPFSTSSLLPVVTLVTCTETEPLEKPKYSNTKIKKRAVYSSKKKLTSSKEKKPTKRHYKKPKVTARKGKKCGIVSKSEETKFVKIAPRPTQVEDNFDAFDGRNGYFTLIAPKPYQQKKEFSVAPFELILLTTDTSVEHVTNFENLMLIAHETPDGACSSSTAPLFVEEIAAAAFSNGSNKDTLVEPEVTVDSGSAPNLENPENSEVNNVGGAGVEGKEQTIEFADGSLASTDDSQSKAKAVPTEDKAAEAPNTVAGEPSAVETFKKSDGDLQDKNVATIETKSFSPSENSDAFYGDKAAGLVSEDSVCSRVETTSDPARSSDANDKQLNSIVNLGRPMEHMNPQKRENLKQSGEKTRKRERKAPKISGRFLVASAECVIIEKVANTDLTETTDIYLAAPAKTLANIASSKNSSGQLNLDLAEDLEIGEAASGQDQHLHDIAEQMGEFLHFKRREAVLSHPAADKAGSASLINDKTNEAIPAVDFNLSEPALVPPLENDSGTDNMAEIAFPTVDFSLLPPVDDLDDVMNKQ